MKQGIIIIGAGGFGRHVLAILRSQPYWEEENFLGFLDDGSVNEGRLQILGAQFLGTTDQLEKFPPGTQYVVGIGNGHVREKLAMKADRAGLEPLTVIHPDSWIASDVVMGKGAVICAGVRITTNVKLGNQVHLNMNVTVGHDVELEGYTTVFPQVAIGGETSIRKYVTLGAGATINPGIVIGEKAFVAAGAVVLKTVESGTLVAGVPAVLKKRLV